MVLWFWFVSCNYDVRGGVARRWQITPRMCDHWPSFLMMMITILTTLWSGRNNSSRPNHRIHVHCSSGRNIGVDMMAYRKGAEQPNRRTASKSLCAALNKTTTARSAWVVPLWFLRRARLIPSLWRTFGEKSTAHVSVLSIVLERRARLIFHIVESFGGRRSSTLHKCLFQCF